MSTVRHTFDGNQLNESDYLKMSDNFKGSRLLHDCLEVKFATGSKKSVERLICRFFKEFLISLLQLNLNLWGTIYEATRPGVQLCER